MIMIYQNLMTSHSHIGRDNLSASKQEVSQVASLNLLRTAFPLARALLC